MIQPTPSPLSFRAVPPSIMRRLEQLLEPLLAVLTLLVIVAEQATLPERTVFVIGVIVFALGYPAPSRLHLTPAQAARAIAASWLRQAALLLLIGAALRALDLLPLALIIGFVLAVPVVQWLVIQILRTFIDHDAAGAGGGRDVVVVGSSRWGAHVAGTLANRGKGRDRVIGFFDDRSDARLDARAADRRLGGLDDLVEYVRAHRIAEVHITLPLLDNARVQTLVTRLQATTASVFYIPDLSGIGVVQGRLEDRDGLPLVALCETPFTGTNLLVKRSSDLVLASVALVLLAPLMMAIALGVKLSGPGPVLFRQRRNGLDGEEIIVYKFRSMTTLDDGEVVHQATRGDPRVTRFGRFIRRTSLDELPQFINVLQGRMSVVGPRPHAVAHNQLYRDRVRAYMVRHKVRPGITGLAQINGARGETDTLEKMQRRVEYDLEYLRTWSLALDLKIVLRTIALVLRDRQAF